MKKFNHNEWAKEFVKNNPHLDPRDKNVMEQARREAKIAENKFYAAQGDELPIASANNPKKNYKIILLFMLLLFIMLSVFSEKIYEKFYKNRSHVALQQKPAQDNSQQLTDQQEAEKILINRCAVAAVREGFVTPSCAEFFMSQCVETRSRSAMAQAVTIGQMNGVLRNKYATCSNGEFTPAYGRAIKAAIVEQDKF